MYAATHPYTIDENGKRKYVSCQWGIVDETLMVVLLHTPQGRRMLHTEDARLSRKPAELEH